MTTNRRFQRRFLVTSLCTPGLCHLENVGPKVAVTNYSRAAIFNAKKRLVGVGRLESRLLCLTHNGVIQSELEAENNQTVGQQKGKI